MGDQETIKTQETVKDLVVCVGGGKSTDVLKPCQSKQFETATVHRQLFS